MNLLFPNEYVKSYCTKSVSTIIMQALHIFWRTCRDLSFKIKRTVIHYIFLNKTQFLFIFWNLLKKIIHWYRHQSQNSLNPLPDGRIKPKLSYSNLASSHTVFYLERSMNGGDELIDFFASFNNLIFYSVEYLCAIIYMFAHVHMVHVNM